MGADLPHGNAKIRATLARSLQGVQIEPRDAALVHLADRYARELDAGGDLAKLGPPFQRALAALGLTPEVRKAVVKPDAPSGGDPGADELARLRARARAR